MKTLWFKIPSLLLILLGTPVIGIILSGKSPSRYLEFPPRTQFIDKAPFSVFAFGIFLLLIIIVIVPLSIKCFQAFSKAVTTANINKFPWWGYLGIGLMAFFWAIAWNRFDWAELIQEHTFFPLWFSYILVINALTFRRRGQCHLTHQPVYFLLLFIVSAGFWWFFEYLNRFVQNWNYTGTQYGSLKYFLLASLAFSTVLPAVLGTMEYLLGFSWLNKEFHFNISFKISHPRTLACSGLLFAVLSLCFVGIYPNYLFPFLWVSPVVLILCLKTVFNEPHLLYLNSSTNQKRAMAAMLAALICGLFWEMWNYWSLIKWHYDIPLVNRYHLFEMPILGYAGYLPFGLECAVIGDSLLNFIKQKQ